MGLLETPANIGSAILDPLSALIKNPFSQQVKNTERGQDFPHGFQIFEIIDGVEQSKPAVTLIGNMLPMIPFTFGGSQRVKKDYYPGNSEPAVQVLGPQEGDTLLKGKLKDKRYKNSSLYGVSEQVQRQIDAVRIRGNLCKFVLGEWKRFGFVEDVQFHLNKLSDIDYEIKLMIVGFNKPLNAKFVTKKKDAPFSINTDLINQALAFQATYSSVPASMPQSIAGLIKGLLSDVAKTINLVTGFVDTVVSTAEDIVSAANRGLGLIKNARTGIAVFKRRIGAIRLDTATLSNDTRAARQFVSTTENQAHITRALAAAHAMSLLLANMQAQFEALAKTVPQARYLSKQGDTLQKISTKFYGSADHWKVIFDHNKLTTTVLANGTFLEIPKL